jgi:porphobilinogen synthase
MDIQFARHRRLRNSANMREMLRENHLRVEDFIYPIFVVEGENKKNEVSSMPGVFQLSLDLLNKEIEEVVSLGIKSIIFFGVPKQYQND